MVYLYTFISVHIPLGNDRNGRNIYLKQDRAKGGSFDSNLIVGTNLYLDFETSMACHPDNKIAINF